MQNIANGKEITSIEMESMISELSGYLNKLTPTDTDVPTEEPTMTEENKTGSTNFDPDSFF